MKQPIVSVCIPAFNQCAYLKLAIASALAQSVQDIEVIVVDDGSKDDTRGICASFNDPRVRYTYQDNDGSLGLGARNRAILQARGEWIALLDQDDLWRPDKLAKQLRLAQDRPDVGLIFSRVAFIDAEGRITGEQQGPLPQGDVLPRLLESNCYFACTGLFRASLLPRTGLPGAPHGLHDWLMWVSLARQTTCLVSDEVLADYRIHAAGYQVSLRAANRFNNCMDHVRTYRAMAPQVRQDSPACKTAFARQRRVLAHELMRTARHYVKAGEFKHGCTQALRHAVAIDPGWLLRPWVALQQGLALLVACLQGLPKLLAHQPGPRT